MLRGQIDCCGGGDVLFVVGVCTRANLLRVCLVPIWPHSCLAVYGLGGNRCAGVFLGFGFDGLPSSPFQAFRSVTSGL